MENTPTGPIPVVFTTTFGDPDFPREMADVVIADPDCPGCPECAVGLTWFADGCGVFDVYRLNAECRTAECRAAAKVPAHA